MSAAWDVQYLWPKALPESQTTAIMPPNLNLNTEVLNVIRILIALSVVCLMTACSDENSDAAKKAIKQNLPVAYEVEYGEFTNYPGGVICGEFTPIGRFGIPENTKPFIFMNGTANFVPSEDDRAIFCSKDQERQFRRRLGIDKTDKDSSSLQAVHLDLQKIDQALSLYLSDNRIYPLTPQGLQALVAASEISPKPPRFRDGGYMNEIPNDPWGRPYQYVSEDVLRGVPIEYTLLTLGRDGEPGGEGEDAEIILHQKKQPETLLEEAVPTA